MQRRKTLLIATMTVVAAVAGFALAGTAFGSDWYDYDGRLTAGNAYLVSVPDGAEALELSFIGNTEEAAATVALFDPADEKVAVWKFSGSEDAQTYVNPEAGDHVLFVYTIQDGGLNLRVNADGAEDATLEVQRLGLDRDDIRIASVDSPKAISESFTARAGDEPVFVTLLYSGYAEGLSALLESREGPVLEVVAETGTSYGPGLYGDVTGERNVYPENLAPGVYNVDASADRFEGDLYLTLVHYDRDTVETPDADADAPEAPEVPEAPETSFLDEGLIPLSPYEPTAFHVDSPGVIQVTIASALAEEAKDEEDEASDHEDHEYGWNGHDRYRERLPSAVSIFSPDDELVDVLFFDEETKTFTVVADTPGEYVAFMRGGSEDNPVLVGLADSDAAPDHRVLDLTVETMELGYTMTLLGEYEAAFMLDRAPILLGYRFGGHESGAIMAEGVFESSLGEAARQWGFIDSGTWSEGHCPSGSAAIAPENLVSGEYTFTLDSLASNGELAAVVVFYDRLTDVVEDVAEDDEGTEESSSNETSESGHDHDHDNDEEHEHGGDSGFDVARELDALVARLAPGLG